MTEALLKAKDIKHLEGKKVFVAYESPVALGEPGWAATRITKVNAAKERVYFEGNFALPTRFILRLTDRKRNVYSRNYNDQKRSDVKDAFKNIRISAGHDEDILVVYVEHGQLYIEKWGLQSFAQGRLGVYCGNFETIPLIDKGMAVLKIRSIHRPDEKHFYRDLYDVSPYIPLKFDIRNPHLLAEIKRFLFQLKGNSVLS